MSDSDTFIDEVTEELRRDRLFAFMRRYGWIAILAIVLLVGGAAWNEWRKASAEAEAQRLGDALLAALEANDPADRAAALERISAETPGGRTVVALMTAGQKAEAGDIAGAVAIYASVAADAEVPEIYRQIASFKALLSQSETLDASERRLGFEALAQPGAALRVLAEEQIALIEVETGETQAAIDRLQGLIADAEATAGLRQRASQLIVALGGEPAPPPASVTQEG